MFNSMNQDLHPRVWIINQFANTPDLPGHTRQYDLGSYLAQKGCGVTVFASDYNLSKRTYQRLKGWHFWKCEHYGNLKWCWLWVSPYRHNNWLRYQNLISFWLSLPVCNQNNMNGKILLTGATGVYRTICLFGVT